MLPDFRIGFPEVAGLSIVGSTIGALVCGAAIGGMSTTAALGALAGAILPPAFLLLPRVFGPGVQR